MSQEYKDLITSIFKEVLEGENLEQNFKDFDPSIYEELIREALKESGYPVDVDIKKVRYDFKLSNKTEESEWAEQFMNEYGLDEESTTVVSHDVVEVYVFDHLENLNVQITIKDELKDWIASNPTVEYMEEAIKSNYNPLAMANFMKRNHYTSLQQLEEACIESGIPREEVGKVDYEIKNLRIKTPINALAEVYAEEVNDSNTTTQIYLDNNLYENLITEVEYDINILSNAEDY